jgi:hypothetical protein
MGFKISEENKLCTCQESNTEPLVVHPVTLVSILSAVMYSEKQLSLHAAFCEFHLAMRKK